MLHISSSKAKIACEVDLSQSTIVGILFFVKFVGIHILGFSIIIYVHRSFNNEQSPIMSSVNKTHINFEHNKINTLYEYDTCFKKTCNWGWESGSTVTSNSGMKMLSKMF